ncbi:MAG: hypothetical protein J0I20_20715 [Chloroflexi bacterium]|nr:hypothetical protein [Chloroflexota bacterium]
MTKQKFYLCLVVFTPTLIILIQYDDQYGPATPSRAGREEAGETQGRSA